MYNETGISIIVSSDMQFPDLVLEIYWNSGLIAIIRKDNNTDKFFFECLPVEKTNSRFYGSVPLEELLAAVEEAKQYLL